MGREVEVGAAVDAFQFLEAEGEVELELDVGGGVGFIGYSSSIITPVP